MGRGEEGRDAIGERCHGAAGMEPCPIQPDKAEAGGSLLPAPIPLLPHPGLSLVQLQFFRAGNPSSPSPFLGAIPLPGPGCTGGSGVSTAGDR